MSVGLPEYPLPGLELAAYFYRDAVRPILDRRFPRLPYAAALIGDGSEVLGFDDRVSTDHHWGPRAMLFLREEDHAPLSSAIHDALAAELPHDFFGWPTSFAEPRPDDPGTRHLERRTSGPVSHLVEIHTVNGFFTAFLGFDGSRPPSTLEWLTFPSQKLRALTTGSVFHDEVGLDEPRSRLAWYPRDVWLWLLAAGWTRIGQEEHLMGRAGQVGDEIGSSVIAARLVRDLMRICFLLERQYAPYPKWFGTAFARLDIGPRIAPLLWSVLRAETWVDRDRALGEAYGAVVHVFNDRAVVDPVETRASSFWKRPFTVIHGDRIARTLLDRIEDPGVRAIPFVLGSVDQWSDSTDLLEATALRARLEGLYRTLD